jgi:hypothetical protein
MSTTLSHPRGSLSRSPLYVTIQVFFQRGALSRRLAAGENPASSPELERRAEQLLSARNRRVLAQCVERVIEAAEERPHPDSSVVPIRRAAILSERQALLSLARELRDSDQRVSVRGVALVERLLTDGTSPFYVEGEESLDRVVRQAHSALFLG